MNNITIVRKINYNEVRFTFLEKEGDGVERVFQRSRLLDWNFLGYVLRRGYATGALLF